MRLRAGVCACVRACVCVRKCVRKCVSGEEKDWGRGVDEQRED